MAKVERYNIALGLKDKDTKRQEIGLLDAIKKTRGIIREGNFTGASFQNGDGDYQHNDKTWVEESTLYIQLLFTTKEKATELCQRLSKDFNQESVMLTTDTVDVEFIGAN